MKLKKVLLTSMVAASFVLTGCNKDVAKTTVKTETTTPTTSQTSVITTTTQAKKVYTHAEYISAKVDEEVTIKAVIQERCTFYNNKASFYLADKDGGYYVYNLACTEEEYQTLVKGTELEITGSKAEWKGQAEIDYGKATENQEWKITGTNKEIRQVISVSNISKAELDKYKNLVVSVTELTVTEAPFTDWTTKEFTPAVGTDIYFTVKDSQNNTATYVVESYLESTQFDSTVYTKAGQLKVGDKINLKGFVYYYDEPQLQVTEITDFVTE